MFTTTSHTELDRIAAESVDPPMQVSNNDAHHINLALESFLLSGISPTKRGFQLCFHQAGDPADFLIEPAFHWNFLPVDPEADTLPGRTAHDRLIFSPAMERVFQAVLKILEADRYDAAHRMREDPVVHHVIEFFEAFVNHWDRGMDDVIQQIRLRIELSSWFSTATIQSLYSGSIPRRHLEAALLLERHPPLRDYLKTFPLLIMALAESVVETGSWNPHLACEIAGALRHGWRGLFHLVGLPCDEQTVHTVKAVCLAQIYPCVIQQEERDPHTRNYIGLLRNRDERLKLAVPPYAEHWLNAVEQFSSICHDSGIALNHLNQQLLYTRSKIHVKRLLEESRGDPAEIAARTRRFRKDYLTIMECIPFGDTSKKIAGFQGLPSSSLNRCPWLEAKRQWTFDMSLTAEERHQLRPVLDSTCEETALKVLDREDLSSNVFKFLSWTRSEAVHRKIIEHNNVPLDLLQHFHIIYPDWVESSPAGLFHVFMGDPLMVDSTSEGTFPLRMADWNELVIDVEAFPLGDLTEFVNTYGETRLGEKIGRFAPFEVREHAARSLRASPPCMLYDIFSLDDDSRIRMALCLNPFKPESITRRLAVDKDPLVRKMLAAQPLFMIRPVCDQLQADTDPSVRETLSNNPYLKPR